MEATGKVGSTTRDIPVASQELEKQYSAALHAFMEKAAESQLKNASTVARKAIDNGLGVLDLTSIFQKALLEFSKGIPASGLSEAEVERSMRFFIESIAPFEITPPGSGGELQPQSEELETVRQRYRKHFEFAPDGYLVTDSQGIIEEANVAAAELFHADGKSLVGESLSSFLGEEAQDTFNARLQEMQSGLVERVHDWHETINLNTGRAFPAAITVSVSRSEAGNPIGLRWLVRDITDSGKPEAENLLRERLASAEGAAARGLALLADVSALLATSLDSETTLKSVARLVVPFLADWCFVYIVDEGGVVHCRASVHAQPADDALAEGFARQLSRRVPEWIMRSLDTARSEIIKQIPTEPVKSVTAGDEHPDLIERCAPGCIMVVPLIARGRTLGAIALLSTQSERVFSDADRVFAEDLARRCAYAMDNSRLYHEVIVQRDKAEKANRAKDEFLSILSHELRNPLVPILGWSRILKSHADRTDTVLVEGILSLERNARSVERLVDDCLEMVRTSTRRIQLKLERVDLNVVLTASIATVVPQAREKGLDLHVDLSPTPLWIIGDRVRLEQVVVNLLTNAVKFTSAGSIQIRSYCVYDDAQLHVKDTGIGIAADFIEDIFEPFRHLTDTWLTSNSGLGIGLSIAREVIRLHSGRIWAESGGLQKGSTFFVAIPTLGAREPSPIPRVRLLLVEDSHDVLVLTKQELEWIGHTVYTASDGISALEIAKREVPDLIISDIKMPKLDGYQFLQEVRAIPELASIPAIAVTGFGTDRDIAQARLAGYDAHLVKPVDIDEMNRLIDRLCPWRSGRSSGR